MKIIGMISGTSYDGIDTACCDFSLENKKLTITVLAFESYPYPEDVYNKISQAMPPKSITMEDVCILDTRIGQEFAAAASKISRENDFSADLVVSHGQTLFHWIDENLKAQGTLQLGEPAWISQATGLPTLSNLRARDVAAGGQGAPLVSILDQLLLGSSEVPVGALNLGGISNITVTGKSLQPLAYDIGPANGLMDAAMTAFTKGESTFDKEGATARSGEIQEEILSAMLKHPYYAMPWPKSTGKEIFHLPYIIENFGPIETWNLPNVMATLTELTSETVARDVEAHKLSTLYIAGGGSDNPYLVERMRMRLKNCEVLPISHIGIDPRQKEAIAFALLGYLSLHGLAGSLPACTGASSPQILGSFTPGAKPLVMPPPLSEYPETLSILS